MFEGGVKTIGIIIVVIIIIMFAWKQILAVSIYTFVWLFYIVADGPAATFRTKPNPIRFMFH